MLGDRFDASSALIEKIAGHSGVAVVLIHPDITGHKLDFERRLIERWRGRAWIGSVRDFGQWWKARNDLETDVVTGPHGLSLMVDAPHPISGLEVELPKTPHLGRRSVRFEHLSGSSQVALGH